MSTPTDPAAPAAVPTPAEAVASGQIPATAPVPPPPSPSAPVPAMAPSAGQGGPAPDAPAAGEPTDVDLAAEVAKWKAMSRQHERRSLAALGLSSTDELDALRDAATKYREHEDAQKSEMQRATERAEGLQQQLAALEAQNARLMAAATHNLPTDLIDLLGTGSAEEINTRAEVLAERLKAAAPPPAPPATARPVEALTPGAAPASDRSALSVDALIRRAAGRPTS
ncbi:hypothetical protein [Streptomyces sp. NPDC047315]|uniref:hypothetical protein n=1 Tax=Streptomyces sp. NPDC047315 TaxID=3155142 RepID=UPI00340725C4